jgi:hypothetical protein
MVVGLDTVEKKRMETNAASGGGGRRGGVGRCSTIGGRSEVRGRRAVEKALQLASYGCGMETVGCNVRKEDEWERNFTWLSNREEGNGVASAGLCPSGCLAQQATTSVRSFSILHFSFFNT